MACLLDKSAIYMIGNKLENFRKKMNFLVDRQENAKIRIDK